MILSTLDWVIIGAYGVITFTLGIWYTRRANQSLEDYFVAGRSLPWWVAGTSIAATWFATDAPLAAASLVRQHGIFGNWLWWYETGGLMLLVFFIAKYWRRSQLLTDAELIEFRYSGRSAAILRLVSAIYQGLIRNCVVMGWVMLAMVKFADVLLDWEPMFTLAVCGILAIGYTIASGLWGVVVTDLFQFVTGLFGSIVLAVIVVNHLGGPVQMIASINALNDTPPGVLDILPNPDHTTPLEMVSYLCLFLVLWSRSGQSGYPAQRLFATKNDAGAMKATFLWAILGIIVITWPWVIVGLGSLVVFPISEASPALAADPELAYPMMLGELMPSGLRGLLVASFLAAFMSTMDTRLCWGGSYIVNDIYRRFIYKSGDEKHYLLASKISILLLAGLAVWTAFNMKSIEGAWIYIIDLTSGLAVVWALRWYWWRVNAWAEISAMVGSLILANGRFVFPFMNKIYLLPDSIYESIMVIYTKEFNLIRAVIILIICTIIWVIVALLTKPVDQKVLQIFYRKVRPGGWWGPVAQSNMDITTDLTGSQRWMGFFLGLIFVDGILLSIGYIVTLRYITALIIFIISIFAFWGSISLIKRSTSNAIKNTE